MYLHEVIYILVPELLKICQILSLFLFKGENVLEPVKDLVHLEEQSTSFTGMYINVIT